MVIAKSIDTHPNINCTSGIRGSKLNDMLATIGARDFDGNNAQDLLRISSIL